MKLSSLIETYTQEEDCCGRGGYDIQEVELSIADGGGGPYLIIKTERWALDSDAVDAFAAQLKTVLAKVRA